MKPPLFIIGNPRSGTTLLRLMLNNHKEIVVPPECGFAVWFMNEFSDWGKVRGTEYWIGEFIKVLSSARKIETWGLDYEMLKKHLVEKAPQTYAEAVSCVYMYHGLCNSDIMPSRWGDKNNYYMDHLQEINMLYPHCKVLHIVRDGRDVACSYRKVNKSDIKSKYAPQLPVGIREIAVEWSNNIRKVLSASEDMDDNRFYEISYENLVTQPQNTLREICQFIEEDYDDNMMSYYHRNRVDEQEPLEFLQWKGKTLDPPVNDRVGVYRRELTVDEIALYNEIAGPCLQRYNYL